MALGERRMIRRRVAGTAGVLAVLAACALPSTAAAARPDLVVTKVTPLTPSVAQKGRVRVSVVVRNAGKGRAKASVAALYLSKDRRKGKSDKRLSGRLKVKALGKRQRVTRKGRLKLPRKAKPGAYVLIACADSKRRVREGKERNNCKPAKVKLGITRPAKRVNVHPHLDTAHADDSGVITPAAGGSLVTFGADGTTFFVIVPPRAVTHAQRVTLTPITRVDGLPLSGGFVAGVQVGTDELQLAK